MSVEIVVYRHPIAERVMQAYKSPRDPEPAICKGCLVVSHVSGRKFLQQSAPASDLTRES